MSYNYQKPSWNFIKFSWQSLIRSYLCSFCSRWVYRMRCNFFWFEIVTDNSFYCTKREREKVLARISSKLEGGSLLRTCRTYSIFASATSKNGRSDLDVSLASSSFFYGNALLILQVVIIWYDKVLCTKAVATIVLRSFTKIIRIFTCYRWNPLSIFIT